MKKIGFVFLAALLLVGTVAVVFSLLYSFSKLPGPFATIIAGVVGFLGSKFYEAYTQDKTRLFEKKREIYHQLIKPFRDVLINTKLKKDTEHEGPLPDEFIKGAIEAAFDSMFYASDDVIKLYGEYRSISVNGLVDSDYNLKSLAKLLKAMRKDLGNKYSSIDEVDILKLFINMDYAEEAMYREKFK